MEPRPDIRNDTYVHSQGVLASEPGRLYHFTYEGQKENDGAGGGTYRYHAIHPPVVEERGEDAAEPGRPTSSEPPPERKADCNGYAVTDVTGNIPNKPMGRCATLHRPSATLACNETTAFSTPTAKSMEKIISSRQNAKDGTQEYLIQRERGQTELDRSGSWT
jgi:hypothetical protein